MAPSDVLPVASKDGEINDDGEHHDQWRPPFSGGHLDVFVKMIGPRPNLVHAVHAAKCDAGCMPSSRQLIIVTILRRTHGTHIRRCDK